MIKPQPLITSKDFKVGLFTRSDIIQANPDFSPNCMDIKWYFDDAIGKRFGTSTTNSIVITMGQNSGWVTDSTGTLTTSMQSYWKLDEASDTRYDSYDDVNLSNNRNTSSVTGIRNLGALFTASASNSLLHTTTASLEAGTTNFSIAGWVYFNSLPTTNEYAIVSKRDPSIDAPTALLLHCDGVDGSTTFTDSSKSGKTITANGAAQVDTAQSKFGGASALFNGSSSLSTPDSPDWDFSSSLTFEFWVRFNTVASCTFIDNNNNLTFAVTWRSDIQALGLFLQGSFLTFSWLPVANTWYHVAITRDSSNVRAFINGVQIGTTQSNSTSITSSNPLFIGSNADGSSGFDGWLDEIRISNGVGRWTSNFTVPNNPYGVLQYEYYLYAATNNTLNFSLSNTGSGPTATVSASSLGSITTSTWYNFVAWHSNNSHIGISVNMSANTMTYNSGGIAGTAPFVLGALSDGLSGFATNYLDGRMDEVGFWKKVLSSGERSSLYGGGTGNTFTPAGDQNSWYSFDFGASGTRWLTIAAGTGIMASSNCGTSFVNIASTRTATYQYMDRSRNVMIMTSDAYDQTLYWAGSAGTSAAALAVNSAPKAKFSINYQGFLILLNYANSNGVVSNRGFAYADDNLQLSSSWPDRFDLPSSADDEITGPFILNKFLYVSTKFRIFRLNYTGGNPDWQYIQVKNFGFVPRTIKVFTMKQGQVAVGLDWNRRLRAFDGYDDQIISDNVENFNDNCPFAMDNISLVGSGLLVSNAEFDPVEQEYRLNVALGPQSTQTTHAIVLNARTLALYPYSNQPYNTMCVAESAGRQFLMGFDRSGLCHILNSGNLDAGTITINENYDSPLLFRNSPSEVSKNKQINFYFTHESAGKIYYQERFDFSNVFLPVKVLKNYAGESDLTGNESSIIISRSLDLPSTQNIYQFRITSSSGTAIPWKLTYFDLANTAFGIGRGK